MSISGCLVTTWDILHVIPSSVMNGDGVDVKVNIDEVHGVRWLIEIRPNQFGG